MKYLKLIILSIISLLLTSCTPTKKINENTFNIVTSFYPIYLLTSNITKDTHNVSVENLTSPTEGCLHDYQLTTADLRHLENADCLIINGLGMEGFIDKALEQYPDLIIIDTSKDTASLNLLESGHTHNHDEHTDEDEHDHIHNETCEFNSHIWLDIDNAVVQAKSISTALGNLDKENKDLYDSNFEKFKSNVEAVNNDMTLPSKSKLTISFHEGFDYMIEKYGFHIEKTFSLEENAQASAHEISELIDEINEENIKVLFAANDSTLNIAKTIANETDAKIYILDPITSGEGNYMEYIEKMSNNIKVIQEAYYE